MTDRDSKIKAVCGQTELKKIINALEKERKFWKEPLIEAGRKLDELIKKEKMDMERELDRITQLVSAHDEEERIKIQEEQRRQQQELERIERERQAELKRLADEQAAREQAERDRQAEEARKVNEAHLAALKLASEAKNEEERKAAAKAAEEAQAAQRAQLEEKARQDAILAENARQTAAQVAQIEDKAGDAAYLASRPIETTRVAGQRQASTWEIVSINDWQLAKGRPDLVTKITFDQRLMKAELARGVKLPGVEAKEVFTSGVRLTKADNVIDV